MKTHVYRILNVNRIAAGGWYCRVCEGEGRHAKTLHETGVYATKEEARAAAEAWADKQIPNDRS